MSSIREHIVALNEKKEAIQEQIRALQAVCVHPNTVRMSDPRYVPVTCADTYGWVVRHRCSDCDYEFDKEI